MLLAVIMVSFLFISTIYIRSFLLADIDKRLVFTYERYKDFLSHSKRTGNFRRPMRPPGNNFPRNDFLPGIYFNSSGKSLFPEEIPEELSYPLIELSFKKALNGEKSFSYAEHNGTKYRVLYVPVKISGNNTKFPETRGAMPPEHSTTETEEVSAKKIENNTRFLGTQGVIQLAHSTTEADALLRGLTAALAVLIPIALILAGLGGYLTTNNIIGPVKKMTEAAENITDTDLSKRIPVIGGDEFAKLAGTINTMLSRLDTSFSDLKSAFEREQRFTSDASHELRTPLTVIKGGTSLALAKNRTIDYYKDTLKEIEHSSDLMGSIIEDLLVMARSENGSLLLHLKTVNSSDLFNEAINLTSALSKQKKINIEIKGKSVLVYCDLKYFTRVIVNIFTNSIRHTPEKGKISINADRCGDNTVISIRDNGEGIAPEHIPHLTDRFYRADSSRDRKSGGSGLGLAICKNITELHGGNLTIESKLKEGTTVKITLPDHSEKA